MINSFEFNVSALSKTLLHMLHRYSLNDEGERLQKLNRKKMIEYAGVWARLVFSSQGYSFLVIILYFKPSNIDYHYMSSVADYFACSRNSQYYDYHYETMIVPFIPSAECIVQR